MITEHDLDEAIAECQSVEHPNANTCIKLAAFYTIKDHMYGLGGQSFASEPQNDVVRYTSRTEFASTIHGMDSDAVWSVMDELMTALQVLHPKLYDSVMERITA